MPANHNDIEKRLWDAADELRANSKLKSSEYSIPVLGLIFLRLRELFVNIVNSHRPPQPGRMPQAPRSTCWAFRCCATLQKLTRAEVDDQRLMERTIWTHTTDLAECLGRGQ